jgi:uncharacterized protein (DUF1501 family)
MRRRDLLAAAAAGALAPVLPGCGRDGEPSPAGQPNVNVGNRKFLLVWVNGGWDVTYCLDPKPDAELVDSPEDDVPIEGGDPLSEEYFQTFGENLLIQCNDGEYARPAVSKFFSAYADKVAVLNGIQVGSIGHDPARYRMLTGTPESSKPDLAVIIGHALGAGLPLGSIDFSGFSLAGAYAASNGRVGASGQLKSLLDPTAVLQPPSNVAATQYPLFVPTNAAQAEQQALLAKRMERYYASRGLDTESKRRLQSWFDSQDRVARFRADATSILSSLEVGSAPSFNESVDLALDLLAANVCQTAFVDTGKLWDTHVDNTKQNEYYQTLFDGLHVLMDRIYAPAEGQTVIDSEVTVLVVSEFTRTPRFNLDGGKDHWPVNSCMIMGDGVRGGRAYGATNEELREQTVDLQTGEVDTAGEYLGFANVAAGVLEMCGVDPEEWDGIRGTTPFRGATA